MKPSKEIEDHEDQGRKARQALKQVLGENVAYTLILGVPVKGGTYVGCLSNVTNSDALSMCNVAVAEYEELVQQDQFPA